LNASTELAAPFPWFGGKRRVAPLVWERFGNVATYIEPFAGSLAVLLQRPHVPNREIVNDLDGMIANFWRAVKHAPEETAEWADQPVFENDLHARHKWLVAQRDGLVERLEADPDYCDPKIAGWWVWGQSVWIGSGWCERIDWRQIPQIDGRSQGGGVTRKMPGVGDGSTKGIQSAHVSGGGLLNYLHALQNRLRRVRVCSGDWTRVCGSPVRNAKASLGLFLDPPYRPDGRHKALYTHEDGGTLWDSVRDFAIEAGRNHLIRVALCGYEGGFEMPAEWDCVRWKAVGGYANQGEARLDNAGRERIWFSSACLKTELF